MTEAGFKLQRFAGVRYVKDTPSGTLKNIMMERLDSVEITLAHVLPGFTSNLLAPIDFIMIIMLSVGLIAPIITCMSYSDDLAKLGTILGEVTANVNPENEKELHDRPPVEDGSQCRLDFGGGSGQDRPARP